MKKLSVVVTCTERKIAAATPDLQTRNLSPGPVSRRVTQWHRRVGRAAESVALMNLYQGEHWTQVKALLQTARTAGFEPTLWVASAGLGLQRASAKFPVYAATFSPRQLDTVADTGVDRRLWWKELRRHFGTPELTSLGGRSAVLLVLSDGYAGVLDPEIRELGVAGDEVVLVGGSTDVAGVHRIPADGALRTVLGGTMTGLNARMAAAWLARCSDGRLTAPSTKGLWTKWVGRARVEVRHDREPMTDAEVKAYIRAAVAQNPERSRTRLHRMLRDSGRACEQKRFAALFVETMGEQ